MFGSFSIMNHFQYIIMNSWCLKEDVGMLHVKLVYSTRFPQGNARNYLFIIVFTIVLHQGHTKTHAHIPYKIVGLNQVKIFESS